jgi:kynurenine formamidase
VNEPTPRSDADPLDRFPTYQELRERAGADRGTAWGVFGRDDELGTLNHLTPERVRAAASSICEGRRISLNLSLTEFDPPLISHRGAVSHEVFGLNEFHRDDRVDSFFPQASTQIDSLRHFAHPDHGFYNAVPGHRITSGTAVLGIQRIAEAGIAGRGLLLDIDRFRAEAGRPLDHDAAEKITAAELDEVLQWQGSTVLPGDILLLRFGWPAYRRASPAGAPVTSAGIAQSHDTAAWLWDRRVAVVAADNVAIESWPVRESPLTTLAEEEGRLPRSSHTGMLHRILIPLLGLTLGELWDLDALAVACRDRGRYDAFVVAEPLHLTGGVGSPANALAIV